MCCNVIGKSFRSEHQQLVFGFGNLLSELRHIVVAYTLADAVHVEFDPATQNFRSRLL